MPHRFNYDAPSVAVVRVHEHGVTFKQLRIECSDPNCNCVFCRRLPGQLLPVEAIARFTTYAGWTGNAKKATFFCPAHS